jgi:vancomycin permeability regulator SanA
LADAGGDASAAPAGARPRRFNRVVVAALLAVALVAVWVVAGNAHVLATTSAAIVDGVEAAPPREYVIVLGNRVKDRIPCDELAERLEVGRALYAAGRVRTIIVSGMVRRDYEEPYSMAAWLERKGVPRAAIVIDPHGYRTAATMASAAKMGVRAALIATQPYHLPRSVFLARHAGIDAIGVPARSTSGIVSQRWHARVREMLARAEIVLEVAVRGVK